MASSSHRNLAIDWLKGWMILCIVLVHTWAFPAYHFYLAVDVFFFISGYFMMQSYLRKPTTTVLYTWKRIKVIALPFFVCLIFRCCLDLGSFFSFNSLDDFVNKYAELLYTISFAEEFGVDVSSDQLLLGSWYFSVLIISSFILYGMLEFNEKLSTRVFFPIIALLGFNALIVDSDSFSTWSRIATLGTPLIRGCSEMAAGALICSVFLENKAAFEHHTVFFNVMGIVAAILFILIIFSPTAVDKYLVITIPWVLLASVIDGSWLSKGLEMIRGGIMSRVGQYTLYILCAHWPALILVHWCNEHYFDLALHGVSLALVSVLVVTPATFLLFHACKWIKSFFVANEDQPDHTRV